MSFGISPVYTTLKPPKPGSNVLTLTVSMPWFSVELLIRKQVWDERGLLLPARHHVRLVGPRYLPQELIDGHPVERLWKALELWLGEIMRGQPGGGATRVAERERERQHWWACLLGLQSLVDETLTAYGLVTDGELYWNTLEDPRFSARSTLLWLCEMFKECEPSARLVAEQAFIVAFNDGLLLLKHPLRQWVHEISDRTLRRWRSDADIREQYELMRMKARRRRREIEAECRQRALDERAKLQRLERDKLLPQRAKRGGRRRPW